MVRGFWAAALAGLMAAVLAGCSSDLLPGALAPVYPGLKVGMRAPASNNLVVGERVTLHGKPHVLRWYDTSTSGSPLAAQLQQESVREALARHQYIFVLFDVPVHETNGALNLEYALHLHHLFGKKIAVILIDLWKDPQVAPQWNLSTSAHHAEFLIGPHGHIRYAFVGFFEVQPMRQRIEDLLHHRYRALWQATPATLRLPWRQQPR